MSLLDDVSIVVTPNGYKAGELYAVVPVPTEGAEEIDNGEFTTNLDSWSTSSWWVWNSLGAYHPSTSSHKPLYQQCCVIGKTYLITFDLNCVGSSQAKFSLGSSTGSTTQVIGTSLTSGSYSYYVTAAAEYIVFNRQNTAEFYVDNVSVKEALTVSADMDVTRATAATRVDENGLVNYAEIIGGEEVTNGDFTTADLSDFATTYATQEIVSEELKTTLNTANGYGFSKFTFAAEIGRSYRILASCKQGTSDGTQVRSNSGITLINSGTNTGDWNYDEIGVATSTTCQVRLQAYGASGVYGLFDNISVKEVTRDNVPRIDYSGCPHILAEPQRTNLITYSEDFTDSSWTKTGSVSVSPNSVVSPDGTLNGSTITGLTGSGSNDLRFVTGLNPASTTYTSSVYLKGSGTIKMKISNNVDNSDNTTITLTSSWVRYDLTHTFNATTGSLGLTLDDSGGATATTYDIWGAQLEEGSYATSYIPTSGSTVTRNQDIFTRDGIGSLINSTEGVLFLEVAALTDDTSFRAMSISDGTTSNRITLVYNGGIRAFNVVGGSVSSNINYTTTITTTQKIAILWSSTSFKLWVNGVERGVISGVSIASNTLNKLSLDQGNGGNNMFAKVKQLQVYKTALTDVQLAALTS